MTRKIVSFILLQCLALLVLILRGLKIIVIKKIHDQTLELNSDTAKTVTYKTIYSIKMPIVVVENLSLTVKNIKPISLVYQSGDRSISRNMIELKQISEKELHVVKIVKTQTPMRGAI